MSLTQVQLKLPHGLTLQKKRARDPTRPASRPTMRLLGAYTSLWAYLQQPRPLELQEPGLVLLRADGEPTSANQLGLSANATAGPCASVDQ